MSAQEAADRLNAALQELQGVERTVKSLIAEVSAARAAVLEDADSPDREPYYGVLLLDGIPSGGRVKDRDGDVWTKKVSGSWQLNHGFVHETGERLVRLYGPVRPLSEED